MKRRLFALGFDIGSSGPDKDFKEKTLTAVVALQIHEGLVVDGKVGSGTVSRINTILQSGVYQQLKNELATIQNELIGIRNSNVLSTNCVKYLQGLLSGYFGLKVGGTSTYNTETDAGVKAVHKYSGVTTVGFERFATVDKVLSLLASASSVSGTLKIYQDGLLNPVIVDDGLFLDSDFDLNSEVIQMISYYDDVYFQTKYAYDLGILQKWGYDALRDLCQVEANKLRLANRIDTTNKSIAWDVVCAIGGVMPYAGLLFDIMGNANTAYAVSLGEDALCRVENATNYSRITNAMVRNLESKYTIYEMYDSATGEVKYIGRTRQNIYTRQKQH